jgi:hypothetical protein
LSFALRFIADCKEVQAKSSSVGFEVFTAVTTLKIDFFWGVALGFSAVTSIARIYISRLFSATFSL